MKADDAVYEFLKSEVVPVIAGESELTGAILNGALRASKKKIADKFSTGSTVLQSLGMVREDGELNLETLRDFTEGMFEKKESISVSMAEIIKLATGVDSDNDLLKGKLTLTKSDAEKLLALLAK